MLAAENQTVIMTCVLEAYFALVRTISLDLYLFCEVDQHEGREGFGQHLLQYVFPSQQGVSDANQYEIKAAQIEHEFIEKD